MLGALFEREERELKPWGDWRPSSTTHAGVSVTAENATNLLTVYGATALISDTIATLPIDVVRKEGQRTVEGTTPDWLADGLDRIDLLSQFLTSLLLDGNAYLTWTVPRGAPANVTCLDTSKVHPTVIDGQVVYLVNGQPFTGRLMHVMNVRRAGALKGMSPVEAARESIGLGLAAQEFGSEFFGNGVNMSGVIETPKQMSQEAAKILAQRWGSEHRGIKGAHKPGILTEGATWKPISVTPEQAQFLDTRRFTAAEISAQMFLLDPTLLGIAVDGKSLTYANLEQRGIHLVQFSLLRWIIRAEAAFGRLLPVQGEKVKLNVNGLQRADLKTRMDAYEVGIRAKVTVPNEAREKEDLAPLDEQVRISLDDSEVIGRLIRSGFTAESVIEAVQTGNLSVLEHTGALPTTVQSEDDPPPAAEE